MFETKCTKSIMKYITSASPDSDGFYYMNDFISAHNFPALEVEASVDFLVQESLIKQPFEGRPDIVAPTIYGMKYNHFKAYGMLKFILLSIVCPIAVSFITTLITLYISRP